tara:strand:- start:5039 stop:5716 length:678 start_codon:yes stop_codon:yes gene_type:complete
MEEVLSQGNQDVGVLKGISQVMASFAEHGIAKNSKNESQGFKFRGIDDVLNRLSKHLVEANLVISPQVIDRQVSERTNSRGNALFYVTLTVCYTVHSVLDGSTIQVVTMGEAMDSGDKATNKALSIAYKYMAFQLFAIPIDEDADRQSHEVKPKISNDPTMTAADVKIIKDLLDKAEMAEQQLLSVYKASEIQDIQLKHFAKIVDKLQEKVAQKEQEIQTTKGTN